MIVGVNLDFHPFLNQDPAGDEAMRPRGVLRWRGMSTTTLGTGKERLSDDHSQDKLRAAFRRTQLVVP